MNERMNAETLLDTGLRNLWYPVLASWRLQDSPLGITRLGDQIVLWRDKGGWRAAQLRAMARDHSWERAAAQYEALYRM